MAANETSFQSNNEDLISKLPDELLTRILSFTDTRSAFSTTFLSKRWNRLWISVPNLDFSFYLFERASRKAQFERFVDRVLTSNRVIPVRTIGFYNWKSTEVSLLNSWLASIAKRDAERIMLSLQQSHRYHMPDCFFDQKRLVSLHIENFVCKVPQSVNFPSLRSIRFQSLHLRDDHKGDDSVKNLLLGCPVLTDLCLVIIEWDPKLTLSVTSSTLLSLNLRVDSRLKGFHYGVVIDAPKVKKLVRNGHSTVNYKISNVSSLRNITLRFGDGHQVLCELLKRMIHATELFLHFYSQTAPLNRCFENMPMFRNLIKMTLIIAKDEHWPSVFCMLHCSPCLVTLHLIDNLDACDVAHNCIWEEPNEVPRCFVSSLKRVEMSFDIVKNVKRAVQMISYILKNAAVLKIMYVHIADTNQEQEDEFRRILSILPKSSAECQVIYEDDKDSEDRINGVIKRG